MSHNSQPIIIPKNFNFIESIPVLNREMLISENAVINIYIYIYIYIYIAAVTEMDLLKLYHFLIFQK
jgi:hypothetical protein